MNISEFKYSKILLSLSIVVLTGVISPIITFGINLGIIFQVIEYLTIWAICTAVPVIFFHYAKTRVKFCFKKFGEKTGFCFLPTLISNIIVPFLEKYTTSGIDNIYEIDQIRQALFNWVVQASIFWFIAIPIISFCLFVILLGYFISRVFKVSKAIGILFSIPLVLISIAIEFAVQLGLMIII